MPILNDITAAFGNTPLVRINRLYPESTATVAAKLEFYNPTSSVKDRLAIAMVDAAEQSGQLKPGGSIVEATSGNTGIALAAVGAARGYKVILTMPESMSKERRALLRAYGAELVLTPAPEGMKGAVSRSEAIAAETGAILVKQFENPAGPLFTQPPLPMKSGATPTARLPRLWPELEPAEPSQALAKN
jgi:cysteine synthase A